MLRVKVENQGDVHVGVKVTGAEDVDMWLIKPGDSATIILEDNDTTLEARTLTQEDADIVNLLKYPPPEPDEPAEPPAESPAEPPAEPPAPAPAPEEPTP